ncbi:MAG: 16S rRNA (adenine(1518)-N(6)/adenine(1519)-N(6))-dimethyltransferase RsmA [Actinobacteria bacterium]|nr:16S rRNA (adenine(1518)-N(6)/adenine(1519)-N(6))-dimethyltransferase RsmA [Actinomycetota bacterium]
MTLTRTQVSALLADHGLSPSRALGQNFVVDPNTVRRIARLAGVGPGDHVVEIGAGLGSLTLALAEAGADVTAVEIDRRLVPILRTVVEPSGVRVLEGDALRLDWTGVLGHHPGPWVLVANLPYNVATPLVLDLLDEVPEISRMLVMVQREVGERLAAAPGREAYGIPSVKVAYWATARVVGRVGPDVFVPRPRVESALVSIERRPAPATDAPPARLFDLVRAGFGQRRKMLRRSLAGLVGPDGFAAAGIRPDARAEELAVQDWGRLASVGPPLPPQPAPQPALPPQPASQPAPAEGAARLPARSGRRGRTRPNRSR